MVAPEEIQLTPLAVRTILAALVTDETLFTRWWPVVGPDFFPDAYYKRVASYIDAYWKKYGKCPDPSVIIDHFQSSAYSEEDQEIYTSVFDDIFSAPLEDWPHYQDHLRLYVRKQAFEHSIELASKLVEKLDFEGAQKAITDAASVGLDLDSGTVSLFDPTEIEKRWDVRTAPEHAVRRVPLSIGNLDSYFQKGPTQKGLKPKTLTVVVGPPAGGKSTALVHIGKWAVLNGFKVLHFTLEMVKEDVVDKYDATLTNIPVNSLSDRAGDALSEMLKLTRYADALRIIERPQYSLSPADLEAFLIRMEQVHCFRPDVVLVDYADLMTGGMGFKVGGSDRRHELNYIYTSLHKLAKVRDLVVVTATQANRAALGKQIINLEDIAEDISKAWISDHILTICQTTKEKQEGRCRLYIAKNRGGVAQVEIAFAQNLATATFAVAGGAAMARVVAAVELSKPVAGKGGSFVVPTGEEEEEEPEPLVVPEVSGA